MRERVLCMCVNECTVKRPIVDPPRKGHNIKDLSTRDTARVPKKLPSI